MLVARINASANGITLRLCRGTADGSTDAVYHERGCTRSEIGDQFGAAVAARVPTKFPADAPSWEITLCSEFWPAGGWPVAEPAE